MSPGRPPQAAEQNPAAPPQSDSQLRSSVAPTVGAVGDIPQSANIEVNRPRQVLLVDDELEMLRALERLLRARGYVVSTANNGTEAVELVRKIDFDAIVSDIAMPEMDGITLLRQIRKYDLYVPVVLVTGAPAVDTAIQALEYGAMQYLTKPVPSEALERALDKAVHIRRMAGLRQRAAELLGKATLQATDRAGLEATFRRTLDSLWIAFHPIVDPKKQTIFGYEALLRSSEPALPHPGAVLEAAERLGQLDTLGRIIRDRASSEFVAEQRSELLFVNLHVTDLLDPHLLSPSSSLSQTAKSVVLEITERSSLDHVTDLRSRIATLRELGFRIAVDDLGAGYAGLSTFALLEPEYVKLDMSLIRGIDVKVTQQKIVRSLTSLCREMGIRVVAEGVETRSERDALIDLDCDLLQGFLFAKPGRPFPEVKWP